MNRRRFLRLLGIGAVAAPFTTTSTVSAQPPERLPVSPNGGMTFTGAVVAVDDVSRAIAKARLDQDMADLAQAVRQLDDVNARLRAKADFQERLTERFDRYAAALERAREGRRV